MKRTFVLLILVALLLTACADEAIRDPYTQMVNGVSYYVDPVNKTVTANGYTFSYILSDSHTSVEYPNGAVYTENRYEYAVTSGWSDMGNPEILGDGDTYANCHDLISVIPEPEQAIPEDPYAFKFDPKIFFVALFTLPFGIYMVRKPEEVWYFKYRLHFKNAEPSDTSLGLIVFSGVVLIILGAVSLVVAFL